MAICEIYTEAHPTLKRAGKVIYHAFIKLSFFGSELINGGYEKIPRKHGITIHVPTTNHGYLFPHGV